MLHIIVPDEMWDEVNEQFVYGKEQKLCLEHSLVSISKWEAKHHKAFLSNTPKTDEEIKDYVKDMVITQNVPDSVYDRLSAHNVKQIADYIDDPMTATTFSDKKNTGTRSATTSEMIYYYMIMFNIPFECQKWHLSRLMTLIHICTIKNQPSKKLSKNEILRRNAELNAERRAILHTRG